MPACGDSFWREAGVEKLLAELLEVFEREPFGAEALLERLLGVVERVLAVHQPEEEVLLLLEAVVAQADGVLDDVVRAPFVASAARCADRPRRRRRTFLRRSRSLAGAVVDIRILSLSLWERGRFYSPLPLGRGAGGEGVTFNWPRAKYSVVVRG